MRLKEVIGTIRETDTIIAFLTALFIFAPGIAAIFITDRPLFESLEWVKVTLLAVSFSLPIILFNFIFISQFAKNSKRNTLHQDFVLACMTSAFTIYGALLIQYTTENSWSFITNLVLAQIGACGAILYEEHSPAARAGSTDASSNGAN